MKINIFSPPKYYKKSLELNPENENGKAMLKRIEKE